MGQTIPVRFRLMTLDDVEWVGELERLAFPTPWPTDAFVNELTINKHARYVVAEVEGQVIAYCGMWLLVDEAHITNVAVHPHYRGRGIGERLMRQMMGLALLQGGEKMTLEVRPSNHSARRLYKKLGFMEHGIRRKYYTDNDEDAIIMWVNLREQEN
ncbi:ribosomal protein S18-alanine N-acetyltransferase [Brevibacillus humidisoli]|uniref:ribosomal protein S18-alanine N-acetyltransferase n=1 Tax=Brevibacillus humidisoli TaxID=2895522 RepID=UPI001E3D10C8|nr:ribosomal protein S18-alanine N-acetyltransferase [Brevibacillus humidisoli]UFJ43429.1 ribosomal protein S18-alanine N-acetyltransferase [Brevibacillus humidisoli]